MPNCGSQCWFCDMPIRFDTYEGCSHKCKYCFVQRKKTLVEIKRHEGAQALLNFINGNRNQETRWVDWKIPIHWGGMSDPFQPIEKEKKYSLEALQVLENTGYPCVISTKGRLCIEEPYLSLISKANIVMQISAVCSKYDTIEQGAPSYEERLKIIETLSKKTKRVLVRVQPYICDVFKDVKANIPRIAEAGAYGMIFEGMKFFRKQTGLVKRGTDWVIPAKLLRNDFQRLKDECHKYGLKFYSGENCLRSMGDNLTCCGVDGLEGFEPNTYNLCHMLNGDHVEPRKGQTVKGSAYPFKAIQQEAGEMDFIKNSTFEGYLKYLVAHKPEYVKSVLIPKE